MAEYDDEELKPIFCRTGSKTSIVDKILRIIPNHNTYVEAFAGGAAVFWKKPKANKNVINDLDIELIKGYRALKNASSNSEDYPLVHGDNEQTVLSKMNNFVSKDYTDPDKQVLKTIYKTCNTFGGGGRGKILKSNNQKNKIKKINYYVGKIKNDVNIQSQDYKAILKKYDKPTTFFFLDPPYEKSKGLYKNFYIDFEEMAQLLKKLKGKFLLTINDSSAIRNIFKDFYIYPISVKSQSAGNAYFKAVRNELFITNYDIRQVKNQS